jgi:hypothetical protein
MTDETITFFQQWHKLFKKRDRQYATYYHYVVATFPEQHKQQSPSDRLLVAAFEDVCVFNKTENWKRKDNRPQELCVQCENARPFYELARARVTAAESNK